MLPAVSRAVARTGACTGRLSAGLTVLLCVAAAPAARATAGFDCVMNPSLKLKLAASVSGVLKEVDVDRGAVVSKGELLAKLDGDVDEASLALDRARASLDAVIAGRKARVDFLARKQTRLSQLAAKGDATPTQLDEAGTDLQIAIGDLKEAEKNQELARLETEKQSAIVRQRSIVSPIDGVVVERNLYAGEYTYEQSPIMTVAQIDPLKVEVYLPTALYEAVTVGTTVQVAPEPPLGGHYAATVDVVDDVFDAQSGTFGVRLTLPNPGNKIPAGLRCHATFPNDQSP